MSAQAIERDLPHSDETEQGVLGAVFLDNGILPACRDTLPSPEAFYFERNQIIWRCFFELTDAKSPIDTRTVQAWLERKGKFEQVGGVAYLAGLDLYLPDLGTIDTYLAIVRQLWAKRNLVQAFRRLAAESMNGNHPGDIIHQAQAVLEEIERGQLEAGTANHIGEVCMDLDLDSEPEQGIVGIRSGLRDLDRITQGWLPGQLILIGARPGMGKTSFVQQIMHDSNVLSLLISLEMSEKELVLRNLAQISGVNHGAIKSRRMSRGDRAKVERARSHLLASGLHVYDKPGLTMSAIASTARTHKLKHGLKLLAIDYVGLIESEQRYSSEHLRIDDIVRQCKNLARSLDVPLLLPHQLNRPPKGTPPEPHLTDLREAGENHADIVLLIHRPGEYDKSDRELDGVSKLIVAKHRGGETGVITAHWSGPTLKTTDLAKDW